MLGVERRASAEQIRRAYRERARTLHPDVNAAPDAQGRFAALAAAYEVLSDHAKRAAYNRTLDAGETAASGVHGAAPAAAAHYSWTNIATESTVGGGKSRTRKARTELDEMYDAFFGNGP